MNLPLTQVDAFADRPFTGNPAAVMPLEEWLSDEMLQAIAMENNLAETAFTIPAEDGEADYELRWFTPTVEIEFCGHATLASGYVLMGADRDRMSFRTRWSGTMIVSRAEDGSLNLDVPRIEVGPSDQPALLAALALPKRRSFSAAPRARPPPSSCCATKRPCAPASPTWARYAISS